MARAFSTLELLIAMTVFTLAVAAVLALLPTTSNGSLYTELEQRALEEASERIATARMDAADDFRAVVATSSTKTIEGIPFHESLEVTYLPYFAKRVTARVSWGLFGRGSEVALSSIITDFEGASGSDTCDTSGSPMRLFPEVTHILFGDVVGDTPGSYPLTDIDVAQGMLYASMNVTASPLPSLGPFDAGTVADDGGVGSIAFVQPNGARVSDNQYATAVLAAGDRTHYLRATNFGFHVPDGATIIGIEVDVERKASSNTNTVKDSSVRIVRADGSLGPLEKAQSTSWGTSDAYRTYGGSNDLWNEHGWSSDAVNDPDFGVAFSAAARDGTGMRTASVDHIRVTLTYTKQFYVVRVSGTPALVSGLGQNSVSTGMNAIAIASSTSTGRIAYAAMNSGTTQFESIDLVGAPYVRSAYRIPGASVPASTVFAEHGYAYLGLERNPSGSEFFVLDVHDPDAPRVVGSYELDAGVNDIYVHHGIAYLATDDSAREVVALAVTDVVHPSFRTAYDAPGSVGSGQGRALFALGPSLYLGRSWSLSPAPEFVALTRDLAREVGTFDAGPNASQPFGVYGVAVRGTRIYLLTASNAHGGALRGIETGEHGDFSPGLSLALPHTGRGVALDCETNVLYAASVPTSGTFAGRGSLSLVRP